MVFMVSQLREVISMPCVCVVGVGGPPQFISDVLMYIAHSDPLLRGEISMLIGSLVLSSLGESRQVTHPVAS